LSRKRHFGGSAASLAVQKDSAITIVASRKRMPAIASETPQDGRVAVDDATLGNVLGDHCPRPHQSELSNRDAWQDDCSPTNGRPFLDQTFAYRPILV
jgi:hypothetical protein